jgi:hypothetical protein
MNSGSSCCTEGPVRCLSYVEKVAHLATVHTVRQMLLGSAPLVGNTVCVECLTDCSNNRTHSVCTKASVECRLPQNVRFEVITEVILKCDSMVLGEWFMVFGRIVVPSASGFSGVWLDPEDEDTSDTATVSHPTGPESTHKHSWEVGFSFSPHFILLCDICN